MLLKCSFKAFNHGRGHVCFLSLSLSLSLTVELTVMALIHEAGLLAAAAVVCGK